MHKLMAMTVAFLMSATVAQATVMAGTFAGTIVQTAPDSVRDLTGEPISGTFAYDTDKFMYRDLEPYLPNFIDVGGSAMTATVFVDGPSFSVSDNISNIVAVCQCLTDGVRQDFFQYGMHGVDPSGFRVALNMTLFWMPPMLSGRTDVQDFSYVSPAGPDSFSANGVYQAGVATHIGGFSALQLDAAVNWLSSEPSINVTFEIHAFDVHPVQVPEPASMALLAVGGLAVVFRCRRAIP